MIFARQNSKNKTQKSVFKCECSKSSRKIVFSYFFENFHLIVKLSKRWEKCWALWIWEGAESAIGIWGRVQPCRPYSPTPYFYTFFYIWSLIMQLLLRRFGLLLFQSISLIFHIFLPHSASVFLQKWLKIKNRPEFLGFPFPSHSISPSPQPFSLVVVFFLSIKVQQRDTTHFPHLAICVDLETLSLP